MMKIYYYTEDRICWDGIVEILHETMPFEAVLTTRGFDFHVIITESSNGLVLTVPNWGISAELTDYGDQYWNAKQILRTCSVPVWIAETLAGAIAELGPLRECYEEVYDHEPECDRLIEHLIAHVKSLQCMVLDARYQCSTYMLPPERDLLRCDIYDNIYDIYDDDPGYTDFVERYYGGVDPFCTEEHIRYTQGIARGEYRWIDYHNHRVNMIENIPIDEPF